MKIYLRDTIKLMVSLGEGFKLGLALGLKLGLALDLESLESELGLGLEFESHSFNRIKP